MTKRGIDDLSFNGSVVASTPCGSTTTSVMTSSSTNTVPIKISGSPDANNATADPFNVPNGNASSDYLNGTTNGSIDDHSLTGNDNHKKFKAVDGSVVPASGKSRVVHIRNIPADTTSQELIEIATSFGVVTKHLFVRSKCQAFVEFESHFSAMQMASYWIQTTIGGIPTQVQPTIRGRHVHVQVSNHKELKTHYENSNNGSSNGSSNHANDNGSLMISDSYGDSSEAQHTSAGTSTTPSPVIRVMIENQIYPITLDGLYQAFSRCGKVLKIVTFNKNQQFQALIQFGDLASSIQAKTNYDGQSCYHGASAGFNVMRIEYSKLQNLIVKYNNEKSRDYSMLAQNGSSGSSLNGANALSSSASSSRTIHHLNHHQHESTTSDMASSLLNLGIPSAAGFSTSFNPLTSSAAMNLNGHPNSTAAAAAAFNPHRHYLSAAGHATSIQQALSASAAAALASGTLAAINPTNAAAMFAAGLPTANLVFTSVVHVSGLNPEHVKPDALFTLFGVYGDVIRVKILFNKKDTALIQMAEPSQAQNAISYLDRTRLFGKTIHVMSSKHQMVQMPKEGHQDSGLTKDYTNSPLHRFKRPGSKNYNNIYPPSETLHVSNIPSTCAEEDLRQAFQQETGKNIVKFKFFPNDHRMALIQFDSIEDAILALIKMHNYKVAEHSHLRVSFSKSPV